MRKAFSWSYANFLRHKSMTIPLTIGAGSAAMLFSDPLRERILQTSRGFSSIPWMTFAAVQNAASQKTGPVPKKEGRLAVRLVREIAKELGLECQTFSQDWIIMLTDPKTHQIRYIWGHGFSLNSQASAFLCSDKPSTSAILTAHGLPHVEHKIFLRPTSDWASKEGEFQELFAYAEKHNNNLVLKPANGSGGINVFHCKNRRDIEFAILKLFSENYALAASPFKKIRAEYRIVMLDNQPRLIFRKDRSTLIGDGVSPLRKLLSNYFHEDPRRLDLMLKDTAKDLSKDFNMDRVPARDECVPILWKHNLSRGASASLLTDRDLVEKISDLAIKTATALQVRFVSVDVIDVNGKLEVMEVNSGITIEKAPAFIPDGEKFVKEIYKDAIIKMFEQPLVPELKNRDKKRRSP